MLSMLAQGLWPGCWRGFLIVLGMEDTEDEHPPIRDALLEPSGTSEVFQHNPSEANEKHVRGSSIGQHKWKFPATLSFPPSAPHLLLPNSTNPPPPPHCSRTSASAEMRVRAQVVTFVLSLAAFLLPRWLAALCVVVIVGILCRLKGSLGVLLLSVAGQLCCG